MPIAESSAPMVVGMQADEKRDQHDDLLLGTGVDSERLQRDNREQEMIVRPEEPRC